MVNDAVDQETKALVRPFPTLSTNACEKALAQLLLALQEEMTQSAFRGIHREDEIP